jgi:hypothetical protein
MVSGHVTFNGIANEDLIMILHEKVKHPELVFDPQKLQSANVNGLPQRQVYNSCILGWSNEPALRAVYHVMQKLVQGHETAPL